MPTSAISFNTVFSSLSFSSLFPLLSTSCRLHQVLLFSFHFFGSCKSCLYPFGTSSFNVSTTYFWKYKHQQWVWDGRIGTQQRMREHMTASTAKPAHHTLLTFAALSPVSSAHGSHLLQAVLKLKVPDCWVILINALTEISGFATSAKNYFCYFCTSIFN